MKIVEPVVLEEKKVDNVFRVPDDINILQKIQNTSLF